MKQFLLLSASLLFIIIANAQDRPVNMYDYIRHPHRKDTLCRQELRRAETDIRNGGLRIVQFSDFMTGSPRYNGEFKQLCAEIGMPVYYHTSSCSISETQQQHGCYAYRMSAEISRRFGENFTDSLSQVADARFVKKHLFDTLSVYDCSVMAIPENAPDFDRRHFSVGVNKELAELLSYYEANKPHMIIEFVVNTTGQLSVPFISTELGLYNFPKDREAELLQLCYAELLKTGRWIPSKLGENNVNSRSFAAVFFELLPQ